MKKYAGHIFGIILELLLFAGAALVQYFTNKKMGMARHVIFMNQTWEKAYPLELWTICSVVVLAMLLVLVVILAVKKWERMNQHLLAECVLTLVMTLFSLYFTLTNSAATLRPYYFMSPMFAAAALLQVLRTGVLLLKRKS